ncbi:MAG: hypothetical protein Q9191_008576, partial [Dirinaria sp. TL-2023a]
MLSMSKMVPSGVHTGVWNGWSEIAQKLNGRRLKGAAPSAEAFETPEPALAEKASEDDHSL